MAKQLDLELARTAYVLLHDVLCVKKGESVLITIDSAGNVEVCEELTKMAAALGAKAMLAWHTTPKGYGEMTMPDLPDPLKACVSECDVWIEMNNQWLLYSPIWEKAVNNGRTRQIMLGDLDIGTINRCIGQIDFDLQAKFQNTLHEMTANAKHMRITNPAGTDVEFDIRPGRPITNELLCDKPGAHFLTGQLSWAPEEDTIKGVIAYDGTISGGGDADLGKLEEPLFYDVEKGTIQQIRGGWQADILREHYKNLNRQAGNENMYIAAHVSYGCNPGSILGTCTTENERVWGSTQWGFGHQASFFNENGVPRNAVSHIDGICLNSSVWIDGVQIEDCGKYTHPILADLAEKMGKQ